jgi:probable HAF family extracellular repeat protein
MRTTRRPVPSTLCRWIAASSDFLAHRRSMTGAVVLGLSLVMTPAALCQTFDGLGFPPGEATSASRALSADGSVVAGDGGDAFAGRAFRWTHAGGMENPDLLPGGTYSFGAGMSADGSVVVGYGDSPVGQRAYRWTRAGGIEVLGVLSGGVQSLGSAASADGSVVVGTSGSTNGYRAFRWTRAGGMEDLGTMTGGAISLAYSVSADGSVVVGDGYSPIGDVAFRWTRGGGMERLGALSGGAFSFAYAVSADGSVVVGDSDSPQGDIAYRWTRAGGMVSLGTLPGTWDYMVSNAVNADGSAVVGASVGLDGKAFLWTPSLGLVDLNLYLPTLGIDLSGWLLTDAGGVSADGRTIVGTGTHNGVTEAWLATLFPCPDRSRCSDGTVNSFQCTTDVLFVNGSPGDPNRIVNVAVGSPIQVALNAAPAGPGGPGDSIGRYVIWAWNGAPSGSFSLTAQGHTLGCTVNPTPLQRPSGPQPFQCLHGTGLPLAVCAGVRVSPSPARAPWSVTRGQGFSRPVVLTLQGVLEDSGAANSAGFSVTNAVTVVVQ